MQPNAAGGCVGSRQNYVKQYQAIPFVTLLAKHKPHLSFVLMIAHYYFSYDWSSAETVSLNTDNTHEFE